MSHSALRNRTAGSLPSSIPFFTLALSLVVLVTGDAWAEPGRGPWEKVSSSDGIVVQRRTVEGSPLKEFQGRALIAASIGRVLGGIRDAAHRTEWMGSCAESYVLEEDLVARTQTTYHRTKAPWPVADRDSINRAEMRVEPEQHRVFIPFEGIEHPKAPPVKGVVRMPALRGHWILIPVDGGKATEVEYQVHANPGGVLPDWISNLASKKLPLITIVGLRKQVTRRSYPDFEAEVEASPEWKAMAR